MKTLGQYLKAYPIDRFRRFPGWAENAANARKEKQMVNGAEVEAPRALAPGAFLYLQENLAVTDGIFLDENVIFDKITPEWEAYCKQELAFEVPTFE